MNKVEQYLNEIDLGLNTRTIIELSIAILMFILSAIMYYSASKRNLHLESVLRKITGKKYTIRILKGVKEPNGFCFGGFGNAIFLTEGLVNMMTEREVIAVCLHEVGHITHMDMLQTLALSLTTFSSAHVIYNSVIKSSRIAKSPEVKALCYIILLIILLTTTTKVPELLLGKLHEYKADKYTVRFGYANDLVTALEKLEKWGINYKRKIYGEPSRLERAFDKIDQILDVHPSVKNRIENLFEKQALYDAMTNRNIQSIKKMIKDVF